MVNMEVLESSAGSNKLSLDLSGQSFFQKRGRKHVVKNGMLKGMRYYKELGKAIFEKVEDQDYWVIYMSLLKLTEKKKLKFAFDYLLKIQLINMDISKINPNIFFGLKKKKVRRAIKDVFNQVEKALKQSESLASPKVQNSLDFK